MESVAPHCHRQEIPPEVADKISVIFNFFFDFGGMVAPFIGNAMGKAFGYKKAGDVMGFVSIGWALLYILGVGESVVFKQRSVKIDVPIVYSRAVSNTDLRNFASANF